MKLSKAWESRLKLYAEGDKLWTRNYRVWLREQQFTIWKGKGWKNEY